MKKINKHIEVLRSSEVRLSSLGQESCDAVVSVLKKHYTKVGVTIVNCLTDLEKLVLTKPDLVFMGVKFIPLDLTVALGDSPILWVADYLDRHHIAYTGSGHEAHELELNKPLAKQRVLDNGLATSPFYVINSNDLQSKITRSLAFPLFVKPTDRGGGLGVDDQSVVHNPAQLRAKVSSITTNFQSDSLVEQYLPGREFSVAILKDELSTDFSVMPIELIAPVNKQGLRVLSGQVKADDTERSIAVEAGSVKNAVVKLAMEVFQALGASDYGRIDIRLDQDGTPHFLEANLIPSLKRSPGNYFPKACVLNIGLDYESMIIRIAELGLNRHTDISEDQPGIIDSLAQNLLLEVPAVIVS